jgi:hypothetical protein
MMDVQQVNVKFFVENPDTVDLEAFLTVFNNWIQADVTEELLVDVADYRHVFAGPGVVLIGHEANYSLDNARDRLGLLYNRKADVTGTNHERLRQAVRATLLAAQRLEQEQKLKFSGQEAQVTINDRLIAPNTQETFAALEPDLKVLFNQLYGEDNYEFQRNSDPRERLTINVRTPQHFDVQTLLGSLS